jgi:hypothetical protein
MEALKLSLKTVKTPQLNRERLIEFGRKQAKEGTGPATPAIDMSFIRTIAKGAQPAKSPRSGYLMQSPLHPLGAI